MYKSIDCIKVTLTLFYWLDVSKAKLILRMISHDQASRPTIGEVKDLLDSKRPTTTKTTTAFADSSAPCNEELLSIIEDLRRQVAEKDLIIADLMKRNRNNQSNWSIHRFPFIFKCYFETLSKDDPANIWVNRHYCCVLCWGSWCSSRKTILSVRPHIRKQIGIRYSISWLPQRSDFLSTRV